MRIMTTRAVREAREDGDTIATVRWSSRRCSAVSEEAATVAEVLVDLEALEGVRAVAGAQDARSKSRKRIFLYFPNRHFGRTQTPPPCLYLP